jgi:predicted amidophosphoribosyltransferase
MAHHAAFWLETNTQGMGELPCQREYCSNCQREVAVVEGICPDCGTKFVDE